MNFQNVVLHAILGLASVGWLCSCGSTGREVELLDRGETFYYLPEKAAAPPPKAWPALDSTEFPKITPQECLAIAHAYLEHEWLPTERNAYHGLDTRGIRVDTPDEKFKPVGNYPGWWVPGQKNRSIPYQWGGFSTLEEFDDGIAAGKYAGDIYTPMKRQKLDDAVSQDAVGIDCSGYISRCWKLPRSYSTRELPGLCIPLKTWDELRPGDILNTHNAHVLLFEGWYDAERTAVIVYETGCPPTWKVTRHGLKRKPLEDYGYQAFRYRNMKS